MTSANGGTYAGQYPCDGWVENLEPTYRPHQRTQVHDGYKRPAARGRSDSHIRVYFYLIEAAGRSRQLLTLVVPRRVSFFVHYPDFLLIIESREGKKRGALFAVSQRNEV